MNEGTFISAVNQDNDVEHEAGYLISIRLWERELHQMGDKPHKPEKKFRLRGTKLFPIESQGTSGNSSGFKLFGGFFALKVISAIQWTATCYWLRQHS